MRFAAEEMARIRAERERERVEATQRYRKIEFKLLQLETFFEAGEDRP